MEIRVASRDMHLAAYMKYRGATLTNVSDKTFYFDSDTTETEWRIKHSNSCCKQVDDELLSLKKMIR